MIVLDTNVVSEPLRTAPSERVVAWLDAQHIDTLYLTTVTLAEVRFGIAALPDGRRKRTLAHRFEAETVPLFAGRILTFDETASRAYARLQAEARADGSSMPVMDALIAATCAAQGHALATRNTADFAASGLEVINPWTA